MSKICTTVTEKLVAQRAKLVGWLVGWIVEEKMAAYAAARRRAGRSDRSLHCQRGVFPAAHGRRGRGEARGGRGATGRQGNGIVAA